MAEPIKKFRQGNVSVAVFANKITKNGKDFEVLSVSGQRGYKDKNGQWQNVSSMGINDIPKMIIALTKAYDYATAKEEKVEEEAE